jgi:hypothetical protein
LILILLYPDYTKRDIIPPLNSSNYFLGLSNIGQTIPVGTTLNSVQFNDAYIHEDDAADPGGIEILSDKSKISFVPELSKSNVAISGYFVLYLTNNSGTSQNLIFRAYDRTPPNNTLVGYNKGWTPVTLNNYSGTTKPLTKVIVPFSFSALARNLSHHVYLQVGGFGPTTTIPAQNIELNSAYVYYR